LQHELVQVGELPLEDNPAFCEFEFHTAK